MRLIDGKSLLIADFGGQYLLVRKVLDQTTEVEKRKSKICCYIRPCVTKSADHAAGHEGSTKAVGSLQSQLFDSRCVKCIARCSLQIVPSHVLTFSTTAI